MDEGRKDKPRAAPGSKWSAVSQRQLPHHDELYLENKSLHIRTWKAQVCGFEVLKNTGADQSSLFCPILVRQVANKPANLTNEISY